MCSSEMKEVLFSSELVWSKLLLLCVLLVPSEAFNGNGPFSAHGSGRLYRASSLSIYLDDSPVRSSGVTPMAHPSGSSDEWVDADRPRTVEDYVLNVHGGKYNFDDPSKVGGATGREFADALYSGAASRAAETEIAEEEEAARFENWPNWARRMVETAQLPMNCKDLLLSESGEEVSVQIRNEYRTWEPYYFGIIKLGSDSNYSSINSDGCPYAVTSKIHGKLAPNGGVNNYSDSTDIVVRYRGCNGSLDDDYCLVAGTEEEKWYYRLNLVK